MKEMVTSMFVGCLIGAVVVLTAGVRTVKQDVEVLQAQVAAQGEENSAILNYSFLAEQGREFGEKYPDMPGFARQFGWGTARLTDEKPGQEFLWYAYTNSDANLTFVFNHVLSAESVKPVAMVESWSARVEDSMTFLEVGNSWASAVCDESYPGHTDQCVTSGVLKDMLWELTYRMPFIGEMKVGGEFHEKKLPYVSADR